MFGIESNQTQMETAIKPEHSVMLRSPNLVMLSPIYYELSKRDEIIAEQKVGPGLHSLQKSNVLLVEIPNRW